MRKNFWLAVGFAFLLSTAAQASSADQNSSCHSILQPFPLLPKPSDVEQELVKVLAAPLAENTESFLQTYAQNAQAQQTARRNMTLGKPLLWEGGYSFRLPVGDASSEIVEFAPYTLLFVAEFIIANTTVRTAKLPKAIQNSPVTEKSYFYDAIEHLKVADGLVLIPEDEHEELMKLLDAVKDDRLSPREISDLLKAILQDALNSPLKMATPALAHATLKRMINHEEIASIKAKRKKPAHHTRILDRVLKELTLERVKQDLAFATSPSAADLALHYANLIDELRNFSDGKIKVLSDRLLDVIHHYQKHSNKIAGTRLLLEEHLKYAQGEQVYYPPLVRALRSTFTHQPTARDLVYLRFDKGTEVENERNTFSYKMQQLGYSVLSMRWAIGLD